MHENIDELQDDEVLIRVERPRNGRINNSTMNVSVDEIPSYITNKVSYHEIITGDIIRFTLDIDGCQYDDTILFLEQDLRYILTKFMKTAPRIRILKNESKNAYHIYTNASVSLQMAIHLAKQIKSMRQEYKDIIDTAIYRRFGSLRLWNCCKSDR